MASTHLHGQLQQAGDAVTWKLTDVSEYDTRRPLTPTGINLLGLVRHLTGCEIGYFGYVKALLNPSEVDPCHPTHFRPRRTICDWRARSLFGRQHQVLRRGLLAHVGVLVGKRPVGVAAVANGGWISDFEHGSISWLNLGNGVFKETVTPK